MTELVNLEENINFRFEGSTIHTDELNNLCRKFVKTYGLNSGESSIIKKVCSQYDS